MIETAKGNLLQAEAEALVNTVNCVGAMGKGIALQFKQAYPQMAREYERACDRGDVQPGRMHIWETGQIVGPRYVINFPTKRHWRGQSRYEDIESGLAALVGEVNRLGIESLAIPPLGCGHGGLDWGKVRPMIERAFEAQSQVRILLFEPTGAPAIAERVIRTVRPRMTRSRALFLLAMKQYSALAYETTQLEIQKLAYFLQEAGEQLRLGFKQQIYGPYAENLNKVLQDMEGHLICGFDGSRSPDKVITLESGAAEEAEAFLDQDKDATSRMQRLARLIEGFETPYGMELLASVHWVASHADPRAQSAKEAVTAVHKWNSRKAKLLASSHIEAAWNRLDQESWLPSRA